MTKLDVLLKSQQEMQSTLLLALPIRADVISASRLDTTTRLLQPHTHLSGSSDNPASVDMDGITSPRQLRHSDGSTFDANGTVKVDEDATIHPDHTTRWFGILNWPAVRNITEAIVTDSSHWPDLLEQEITGSPHISVAPSMQYDLSELEDGPTLLPEARVHRLSETYSTCIAAMHPIVTSAQLKAVLEHPNNVIAEIRRLLASSSSNINISIYEPTFSAQAALLCLVLALGECCGSTRGEEVSTGKSLFDLAISLIRQHGSGWKTCILEHVQISLLAGLYHALFSRVIESHACYAKAAHLLYLAMKS
jgi:hypothetical protein